MLLQTHRIFFFFWGGGGGVGGGEGWLSIGFLSHSLMKSNSRFCCMFQTYEFE